MSTSSHAVVLAKRLRTLREKQLGVRVTQQALARALSLDQPVTSPVISTWENTTDPTVPPASRLRAYARFFATHKSIDDGPRLLDDESLDDDERGERIRLEKELLDLRMAAIGVPAGDPGAPIALWSFDDAGPLTIICPDLPGQEKLALSDPADPNFTDAFNYGDLDALIELFGHIRAENPTMAVYFRRASQMIPDDLSGHIVMLGGVAWNAATRRILDRLDLPVRQVRDDPEVTTGEPFEVIADGVVFRPRWAPGTPGELVEDVGQLVRRSNPLNSSRTLTVCNGIHSRGVLGAVRAFTDRRLREANERFLTERFGRAEDFGVLMRVDVFGGRAITPDLSQPERRLFDWPAPEGQEA
jgi:hypothetical protein